MSGCGLRSHPNARGSIVQAKRERVSRPRSLLLVLRHCAWMPPGRLAVRRAGGEEVPWLTKASRLPVASIWRCV